MPSLRRGTIVRITAPAPGKGEIVGLMSDLSSYLVLLKREDFSISGWEKVLDSMKAKNSGVGSRFDVNEAILDKSVYKVYREMDLSSYKVVEMAPPSRQESLEPTFTVGTLLRSVKHRDHIYKIEKIEGDQIFIRDQELSRNSYWWTNAHAIKTYYELAEPVPLDN